MRIVVFTLVTMILVASLQLGKAMQSLELLGSSMALESCCSKKSDLCNLNESGTEQEDSENSNDSCCSTSSCDCTCCTHLVFFYKYSDWSSYSEDMDRDIVGFSSSYQSEYSFSLFHPPIS